LAKQTGKPYRLLTEAEWEYAARAGSATRYYFGDDDKDFCRYGNGADLTFKKTFVWANLPCDDGYLYTAPAGSFLPNAFGLYDMHGNAFQWVEDCYHDSYKATPADGSATTTGDCSRRLQRGGAWTTPAQGLRSARRNNSESRGDTSGVRVARTLTP
jgi:formylglycine-generating enzyme required for sulfatase activity